MVVEAATRVEIGEDFQIVWTHGGYPKHYHGFQVSGDPTRFLRASHPAKTDQTVHQ